MAGNKSTPVSEPATDIQNFDKKLVSSLQPSRLPNIKKIKYLPKLLTGKEKITIRVLLLIIIICVVSIGVRYYYNNYQPIPVAGGEYTEGLVGAPNFINPLLAQTNDVDQDISSLIFSGLMKYDKNLEAVPDIAKDYNISEDQKTYTFNLREDVLWHDGQKLSADDVVFTFSSAKNSNFKSPLLISLRGVEVQKTGDYQIKFTLTEPFTAFLEVLTTGILPEHIWGSIDPLNANLTEYNIKPIGSGQWKFKSLIKDKLGNIKSYALVANDKYYGEKPYIEKINFKFYPDFPSAIRALNNRNIEGISYLPKELKREINNVHAKIYSFYLPQYTAIFFNQKNNELLKQKEVRKALQIGIDKIKILTEALNLEGEIIDGPILPGLTGYNPDLEKVAYDPLTAAKTLDDAGWIRLTPEEYADFIKKQQEEKEKSVNAAAISTATTTESAAENQQAETETAVPPLAPTTTPGLNYYRQKGEAILEIKLTTVDFPENTKAGMLIKKSWEDIGVKVNLEIVSPTKISREFIRPRNYESLLYGEIVGADPDLYPFWHSSQNQDPGLNLAVFSNRNVDKLLEEARQSSDEAVKKEKYTEFQNIIISEIPAIFLFSPTYTYLMDDKIKGLDIERVILPKDRFNNLSEWYINTGRRR